MSTHRGLWGGPATAARTGRASATALAAAALTLTAAAGGPDGDECTTCFPVNEGVFVATTFDNTGTVDKTSCSFNDTVDEWWCYTPQCSGIATATTCNAALFDTSLAVFSACNGSQIACNDDFPGCVFDTSRVSWAVTAGQTYYVRVAGFFFLQGDYVITITCNGCPGEGDCFAAHPNAGCEDFGCCLAVCALDPSCCNSNWDSACASTALSECLNANCPSTGNCFEAHPGPGCRNSDCCNAVCDNDSFCCDVVWDPACALSGLLLCADRACPGGGDCFQANLTPGCDDNLCCNTICIQDAACCDLAWDADCAAAAALQCEQQPDCGVPGTGDCFEIDDTPYCQSEDCCQSVCAMLIQCCLVDWDAACVQIAEDECRPPNDDCAGAVPVADGLTAFTTVDASTDGLALDDACDGGPSGDEQIHRDVWYTYVAPCSGELTVSTCGTATFDTRLAVYGTGDCPDSPLTVIGCNDDGAGCPDHTSEVTVPIVKDETYKIRLGGFGPADTGTGMLQVSHVPAGPATLTLRSIVPPGGVRSGETFDVWVTMSRVCPQAAGGFTAYLSFDTLAMSFVGGSYTAAPFGLPLISPITATGSGTIDLSATLERGMGQLPTSDDAVVAVLTFELLDAECAPTIAFRDHVPPTRIAGGGGGDILPLNLDVFPPERIPGDANFDDVVDVVDLIDLITHWGACPPPPDFCSADLNCDGVVDVLDLIDVVLNWTDFGPP